MLITLEATFVEWIMGSSIEVFVSCGSYSSVLDIHVCNSYR